MRGERWPRRRLGFPRPSHASNLKLLLGVVLIVLLLRWSDSSVVDPEIEITSIEYHDYDLASTDFDSFTNLLISSSSSDNPDYDIEEYDADRGDALRLRRKSATVLSEPGTASPYIVSSSGGNFDPDVVAWSAMAEGNASRAGCFRVCVSSSAANTVAEVYFGADGLLYLYDGYFETELAPYAAGTWYDFRLYFDWQASPAQVALMYGLSDRPAGEPLAQLATMTAKSSLAFFRYIYLYNTQANNQSAWIDDINFYDASQYTVKVSANVSSGLAATAWLNYNYLNDSAPLSCAESERTHALALNGSASVTLAGVGTVRAVACANRSAANGTWYVDASGTAESPQYNVRASVPGFVTTSTGGANGSSSSALTGTETVGVSELKVALTSDDDAASLYYTLNGTGAQCWNGSLYAGEVVLERMGTIEAVGCRADRLQSRAATSDTYRVRNLNAQITLQSTGFYVDAAEVQITCVTVGGLMVYTLGDGNHTDPTCNWDWTNTHWPSAGNVTCGDLGPNATVTLSDDNYIKVIVCRDGNLPSKLSQMDLIILDSGQLIAIIFGSFIVLFLALTLIHGAISGLFSTAKSHQDPWDEDNLKKRREGTEFRLKNLKKREEKEIARLEQLALDKSQKAAAGGGGGGLFAGARRKKEAEELSLPSATKRGPSSVGGGSSRGGGGLSLPPKRASTTPTLRRSSVSSEAAASEASKEALSLPKAMRRGPSVGNLGGRGGGGGGGGGGGQGEVKEGGGEEKREEKKVVDNEEDDVESGTDDEDEDA